MPITRNKDTRLYWNEQGSGPPILLIMGASFSSDMWYSEIASLSVRHRVVWFDNRGTGRSSTVKNYTIEDMADDAVTVLDAAGIERAHIYGASLGGIVLQDLAMRHPARVLSMVLGCTAILTADKPRTPGYVLPLFYLPSVALWKLFGANRGFGSAAPADLVARAKKKMKSDKHTKRGLIEQQKAISGYSTTVEAISRIKKPAIVLHGTEDHRIPIEYGRQLASALPNSEFFAFEGAGHMYTVADPESIMAPVEKFIASVESHSSI